MASRIGPLFLGLWLLAGGAHAATILVRDGAPGEPPVILVSGDLVLGDEEVFTSRTASLAQGMVRFTSDGGNLYAGLEIGRVIGKKGFSTLVPAGSRCASACALAWLAGKERLMAPSAEIGFHAAYEIENGEAYERGAPNAVVGYYLAQLGLSELAIIYLTASPPDDMTWLTPASAAEYGIAVRQTDGPQPDIDQPEIAQPADAEPYERGAGGGPSSMHAVSDAPQRVVTVAPPAGPSLSSPPPELALPADPGAWRAVYRVASGGPDGSVAWERSDMDGRPAITATLRLPGSAAIVAMRFYENPDPSVPAGHLVEIRFSGRLAASPVRRVQAPLVKPSSGARGESLSGLPIPVTGNLFWIALAAEPRRAAHNLELLGAAAWIDIPLLFKDGRRGVLSVETGEAGARLLAELATPTLGAVAP
jgi:hypothetical protein